MGFYAAESSAGASNANIGLPTAPSTPYAGDHVRGFFAPSPDFNRSRNAQIVDVHQEFRIAIAFLALGLPRWLSRDPIGEQGGLNVYDFVKNEAVTHTDALGLMGNAPPGSVTKGCCAGKIYDLSTECCCKDKVYSKSTKPSGIKRCCRYNWTGVIPQHCWIEWPGGSAGLYPDANAPLFGLWGSPGIVAVPEPDTSNKQCTEFQLSDCVCNIDAVKACVADAASKHANGTWLSPTYNFGIFDCGHYPGYLISGCCSLVGCGGSWPPPPTISHW